MRRTLLWLGALAFCGCASAAKLERQAKEHDMRADSAARVRDYDRAAAEKAEAQHLHAKAVKRAYKEGTTEQVVIPTPPAEVPHDAPPVDPIP
jgi:outer membrane murein-binding lipoprotein Lpp